MASSSFLVTEWPKILFDLTIRLWNQYLKNMLHLDISPLSIHVIHNILFKQLGTYVLNGIYHVKIKDILHGNDIYHE